MQRTTTNCRSTQNPARTRARKSKHVLARSLTRVRTHAHTRTHDPPHPPTHPPAHRLTPPPPTHSGTPYRCRGRQSAPPRHLPHRCVRACVRVCVCVCARVCQCPCVCVCVNVVRACVLCLLVRIEQPVCLYRAAALCIEQPVCSTENDALLHIAIYVHTEICDV